MKNGFDTNSFFVRLITFFIDFVIDALPSKEPLKAIENVVPMESKLDPVEDNATTTTNTDGDFIDDDFGLSIKREWEQLRQQQLRIEEEADVHLI